MLLDEVARQDTLEEAMRVMGLDISTKTGVVVLDDQCNTILTEVEKAPEKTASGKAIETFIRANELGARIGQKATSRNVGLAVIEGYAYNKQKSQVLMVELGTMVRHYLRMAGVPYVIAPPSVLKQFVAGKGNVAKDMMLLHVFKSWDFETDSADIADAYGLARLGVYTLFEEQVLQEPAWRRKIVAKFASTRVDVA